MIIAAGIMGGIALALTFLLKQQSDLSIKSNQDSALSLAKSEMTSILMNPIHCNANTSTLPLNATRVALTSLRKCKGDSSNPKCIQAITDVASMVELKFPASGTAASWKDTGVLDDRLKVTKIERTITPVTVPNTCPAAYAPCKGLTTATFYVTFARRKIVKNTSGDTVEDFQSLPEIAIPTVVVTDGTTVLGCPKSWNSTELY